jgi:regulator of sigma E protease
LDFATFFPQFGGLAFTILAFVVALSVIVFVHEFGHYIVARWSGIHAEVFSLGFGPALFGFYDNRGTRWQVALLPLGGYVKFMGDANAASAPEEADLAKSVLSDEEFRRTMHGAPLWARAATVAAGPVFNFILSIVVFSAIFLSRGQIADPLTVENVLPNPEAAIELQAGDELLAIADVSLIDSDTDTGQRQLSTAIKELPLTPLVSYSVRRDGQEISVMGPYPVPAIIGQIVPRSAADDAGLRPNDLIVAIDGAPISAFSQLKDNVEASNGRELALTVWRDGQQLQLAMTPRSVDERVGTNGDTGGSSDTGSFHKQWRIGIVSTMAFSFASESLPPLDALTAAVSQTYAIAEGSLVGMWHMVTGAISTCNMSGPIGIAETSGSMASQGASSFIWFIAVLSTAVGLLNLFPVPVLDGGHLVFFAYEAISGRKPNEGWQRGMMTVGLAFILSLMAIAFGADIFCP